MPNQKNDKASPIQRGQKQTSHDQESIVQIKSNIFTNITASLTYKHTNNKRVKRKLKQRTISL